MSDGLKDYRFALDHQLMIHERIRGTGINVTTGGGYVVRGDTQGFDTPGITEGLGRAIQYMVGIGETHFLSAEIYTMLIGVAQTIPLNWMLQRSMVPCNVGFMSIQLPHVPEQSNRSGLGWYVLADQMLMLTMFGDYKSPTSVRRSYMWRFGMDLEEVVRRTAELYPDEDDLVDDPITMFCYMAALFEFMADQILVRTKRSAARSSQRRALRDRLELAPVIDVIELRRRHYETTVTDAQPVEQREWTCQWIVRGHWRQQWYPSLGRHQPKWITPYVKGPDDKPLKQPRAQVFAVVR